MCVCKHNHGFQLNCLHIYTFRRVREHFLNLMMSHVHAKIYLNFVAVILTS